MIPKDQVPARQMFPVDGTGNYKRTVRYVVEREVGFIVPPKRMTDEQERVEALVMERIRDDFARELPATGWRIVREVV